MDVLLIILLILGGLWFAIEIIWPIIEGIFKSFGNLIGALFKVALIGGAILLIGNLISG